MDRRPHLTQTTDRSEGTRSEAVGPAVARREAPGDAVIQLAMWLRAGRASRGMSVDDVAKVTKIQPRILERLESGKLDGLPAPVFVRGFVRSFARCVGLDECEAQRRYGACAIGSQDLTPTVRALVEVMSDLAPGSASAARATPRKMTAVEVIEFTEASAEPSALAMPPPSDLAAASGSMVSAAAVAMAIDSGAPHANSKKKRGRRRKARAQAVRESSTAGVPRPALATGTPPTASPIVAPAPAPAPAIDLRDAAGPCAAIDASAVTEGHDEPDTDDAHDAAPASGPGGAPRGAIDQGESIAEPSAVAIPAARVAAAIAVPSVAADAASEAVAAASETVEPPAAPPPAAPPPAAAPSRKPSMSTNPPWRRSAQRFATAPAGVPIAAPVVPSLVIDDADPESAERVLEAREEILAPRRSFLPPILLDREDRSARQGGLTVAVILLLIAATLTLSYLMRRPSASGDGVTSREIATQSIG
jgi:hypothetical protein